MADVDCSRSEFLDSLIKNQLPSHSLASGDQAVISQTQNPGEELTAAEKGCSLSEMQEDGYALDCVYHMLSNNPSLFSH